MKKFFTFFFLLFSTFQLIAKADLVVTSATYTSIYGLKTFKQGEPLIVNFTIKNTGNVATTATKVSISFSKDQSLGAGDLSTVVTMPALSIGASTSVQSIIPIPISSAYIGIYYIIIHPDSDELIAEETEYAYLATENGTTKIATFSIVDEYEVDRKLPCPIIFIHGLNGSDKTWTPYKKYMQEYFGWIYGGRFDFCLNKDDNQTKTNNSDWIDFPYNPNRNIADFYDINFDVNNKGDLYVSESFFGFNDNRSNQSAIVKQGFAVSKTIKYVLEVSGASEVILIGHSMGGLAAREYIQNSSNWQKDGKHHVAKLVTVGSPNGGSNETLYTLDYFGGIDNSSEAVRDLRYPSTLFSGKFLSGGQEGSFGIFQTFCNDDVNCDGDENDKITGLNQKTFPSDIGTSCIVSIWTGTTKVKVNNTSITKTIKGDSTGDYIVKSWSQNLNGYLLAQPPLKSPVVEKFDVNEYHGDIHKVKNNFDEVTQTLDEPSFYNQAFDIKDNFVYFGFITEQASNNPVPSPLNKYDLDDYKIVLPSKGKIKFLAWNIAVHDFKVLIADKNYQTIATISSKSFSNMNFETSALDAGEYYIEIQALPNSSSWYQPYAFAYLFTPDSGLFADFSTSNTQGCAPYKVTFKSTSVGTINSFQWDFPGGTPSSSTSSNPTVTYDKAGNYSASLTVKNSSNQDAYEKTNFINIRSQAFAQFTTTSLDSNKVQFTNTTNPNFSGGNISYTWEFGDNSTSSVANVVHKYPKSGSYSCKLTAKNSCGTSSALKVINAKTPTDDGFDVMSSLKIVPNPNNGNFAFKLNSQEVGELKIKIFDLSGRNIYSNIFSKNQNLLESQIDIKNYAKGVYFIKAEINNEIFQEKLLID